MSLKSSIIALAGMVGKCQENSRSLKQCLELGLLEVSKDASGIDGAISAKKLWMNENPSSSFNAGDVTVDNSADYDAFIIYAQHLGGHSYDSYMILKSAINDNSKHYFSECQVDATAGKVSDAIRSAQLAQAEGSSNVVFTISACVNSVIDTYGTTATSSTANGRLIPEMIFGVKF